MAPHGLPFHPHHHRWLVAAPSEQALLDATRIVFDIQRTAGIDLPTDGEIGRFDINHPDTNGMIDAFVRPLAGVRSAVGASDWKAFGAAAGMGFRRKPAGVVEGALGEGSLNLVAECVRAGSLARGDFKFTITSPYMLARTLLDRHYGSIERLALAIGEILGAQAADLPCACLQVDEANVTGNPTDGPIAARAINAVLERFPREKSVHLCFGNYGGRTIQKGGMADAHRFSQRPQGGPRGSRGRTASAVGPSGLTRGGPPHPPRDRGH